MRIGTTGNFGVLRDNKSGKLINFKFEESDLSNLPRWRLEALEELIQDRVAGLLK